MNIFLCHLYHCFKWGNDEGVYFLSENRICSYAEVKYRGIVESLTKELIRILNVRIAILFIFKQMINYLD